MFENLVSQRGSAIYITHTKEAAFKKTLNVSGSTFKSNVASIEGGAIYTSNVDFELENSVILNNQAEGRGGSSFLSCSIENIKRCQYKIKNNIFENNTAMISGGAIFYDLFTPTDIETNTFTTNDAPYGTSIASYPFKLKVINEDLTWTNLLVSGGDIPASILVGVFD